MNARRVVLAILGLALAVGFAWGLPGGDSWAADSISPRSCGLFAIVETYTPGHFHTYPPLQMAILTIVALPFAALAIMRAGTNVDALGAELIKPFYMTGIEIGSRLVTGVMALVIAWNTMRLWRRLAGDRVAAAAGLTIATNAIFVYYAHTGNLDVPAIFWTTWCLLEVDRVLAGEPRERAALLLATMAVLTKDQTAAALLVSIPLAIFVLPWVTRGARPLRRDAVVGALGSIVTYGLISGAIVNPRGFGKRVAFLLGPASQSWATYPHGLRGAVSLTRDALLATPRFTSWPIAIGALLGVAIACTKWRGIHRWRALMPLVCAISFTVFFNLSARRSDDRFLLLQSVLVLPYAALAFDEAWRYFGSPRARAVLAMASAIALGLAALGVASIDATLLADPRYEAERYLATLPAGAHVEVYGGPIFLPRIPKMLVATRPGVEPIADRQPIAGITDVVDPALDVRARQPDAIVLPSELLPLLESDTPAPFGLMGYRDPASRAFFRALNDGSLGYVRTLRAACRLPSPLACREVHGSTAGEVWVFTKRAP